MFLIKDGILIKYVKEEKDGPNIAIPDDVMVIGDYAFADQKDIEVVRLGNQTKIIGNHSFDGCGLSRILMKGCVTIGKYAFANCSNLRRILIGESVRRICDNAFSGTKMETIVLEAKADVFSRWSISNCGHPQITIINKRR